MERTKSEMEVVRANIVKQRAEFKTTAERFEVSSGGSSSSSSSSNSSFFYKL